VKGIAQLGFEVLLLRSSEGLRVELPLLVQTLTSGAEELDVIRWNPIDHEDLLRWCHLFHPT